MAHTRHAIYAATVALEINRHAPGKQPTLRPSEWAAALQEAGFDGIELWENHVLLAPPQERVALRGAALSVRVVNTYCDFTDERQTDYMAIAELAAELSASGVKYNFGPDAGQRDTSLRNIRRFADALPPRTRLLCECHAGTIAEKPTDAARLLDALGPADRFQAIIHSRAEPAVLESWFAALGHRIAHCHVVLPLPAQRDAVQCDAEPGGRQSFHTMLDAGYRGSFAIEFVLPMNAPGESVASLLRQLAADGRWLRDTLGAIDE